MITRISRSPKLCSLVVLCVLFLTPALVIESFGSDSETLPPLYLTIVVHQFS